MSDKFFKLSQDLAARKDLNPSDKIVFCVVLDFLGDNGHCWPGILTLMKKTGLAHQTVLRSIGRLELSGLLIVIRRGKGKSNHYKTSTRIRPVPELDQYQN